MTNTTIAPIDNRLVIVKMNMPQMLVGHWKSCKQTIKYLNLELSDVITLTSEQTSDHLK